jgi:glyoxylase-like metal-dependent hydrolase (beta-lactamase superfamily II)
MSTVKLESLSRRAFLALSAAGALAGSMVGAAAKEAMKGDKNAPWYRFKIGDFEATVVSDGAINIGKYADLYSKTPKEQVEAFVRGEFLSPDAVLLQENCLVLNTGDKLVLFDTGTGRAKAFGDGAGRLGASLAAAGIKAEDIDIVLLTHGHIDHLSGIMAADNRLFPNAQIAISKTDFDFWTDQGKLSAPGLKVLIDAARANLLPNKDRLLFVENGKEPIKGVTAISTPGHTPGHVSYAIASGSVTFLFAGDFATHSAISFKHPDWDFGFDSDPPTASATRVKMLDMAAAERMTLITYHFAFPGIGYVAKDGGAYRYVPASMEF